jgi:hypothetical protein
MWGSRKAVPFEDTRALGLQEPREGLGVFYLIKTRENVDGAMNCKVVTTVFRIGIPQEEDRAVIMLIVWGWAEQQPLRN